MKHIDMLEFLLSKYSKLSKAYSEKIEKDYTLAAINTEYVDYKEIEGFVIQLVMENKMGDSISVKQLPNTKKQIHPNILLNRTYKGEGI